MDISTKFTPGHFEIIFVTFETPVLLLKTSDREMVFSPSGGKSIEFAVKRERK